MAKITCTNKYYILPIYLFYNCKETYYCVIKRNQPMGDLYLPINKDKWVIYPGLDDCCYNSRRNAIRHFRKLEGKAKFLEHLT
jgi:hypothetical protein